MNTIFALLLPRFGFAAVINVSHRTGYPKRKGKKRRRHHTKNDDIYNRPLWHRRKKTTIKARLRGYFLADEHGCYICHCRVHLIQSCEWNDKSANRERESRTRIGSDATFFWDSLSNLVIDDNFRISNNLGLGLDANISAALAIQPVRDREIEII